MWRGRLRQSKKKIPQAINQDWQFCADRLKGPLSKRVWMGGRAVEGTGLENQQACKRLVGSNPTPSATKRPLNGAVFCYAEVYRLGDAGTACKFSIAKKVIGDEGVEFSFHAEGRVSTVARYESDIFTQRTEFFAN